MRFVSSSILMMLVLGCSSPPEVVRTAKAAADSEAAQKGGDATDDTNTPTSNPPTPTLPTPTPTPEVPKETVLEPKAAVAALDGFRWEFPCDKDPGSSDQCDSQAAVDQTKTLLGKPTDLYSVELRFRGVVENMIYKDGTLSNGHFYTGGVPDNDKYNIYAIEVSSPKQVYYVNSYPELGHHSYMLDYNAKIQVNGGATIHFVGDGQNGVEISNFNKFKVPDVEPMNNFYNGQFMQINVVSAELVKGN